MIFNFVLCLAVVTCYATSGVASENEEQNNRLENVCNREIPEDRSVELDGECRSSVNCQQTNPSSECVFKRDNYCVCELPRETQDRKMGKRKFCKTYRGTSCSRKSQCRKKFRQRQKKCRHRQLVCCTKCQNLGSDYSCVPKNECKGKMKKRYQCNKKGEVCCGECFKDDDCEGDQICKAGSCACASPESYYYKSTKKCHMCPADYKTYVGGNRLKMFKDELEYADAVAACEAEGTHLIMVKDLFVAKAVEQIVEAEGVPTDETLWMGLTFVSDLKFKWLDGSPLNLNADGTDITGGYTKWESGTAYDANGGQDCVGLVDTSVWDDKRCTSDYMFICACY